MSGEDDTFDIDIYGDETEEQQEADQGHPDDDLNFGDDGDEAYHDQDVKQGSADQRNGVKAEEKAEIKQETSRTPQLQQGTKRKAEDDDHLHQDHRPSSHHQHHATDPSATLALKLTELNWWTTEEDLRHFCASAQVESELVDLSFGEHKINGKSRGEAYLEFSSAAAADVVKREVEQREAPKEGQSEGKRLNNFHVYFAPVGNPFKGRDSGAQGKKDVAGQPHGGGAYNPNFSRGGSFNRGGGLRGGFNRGGGGGGVGAGYNRGGGFQGGMNNQGGGWGAANMAAGGFAANNPMMAMGMNMPMNMGGYGNMGRGGGMMGRGGFGGGMGPMGAMGMGMGGGRGGMGMGPRGGGGWGAGFQQGGGMVQGGYGGGYGTGMQGQGGPNKRMKPDG